MLIASNGIKTAVVMHDDDAQNPRDPNYQDNLATMTCWHRRYSLGDQHHFDSPRDFLVDLVERHVTDPELFQFVKDGGVDHLRLAETRQGEDSHAAAGDRYEVQCRYGELDEGEWENTGCLVSGDLRRVSGPLHAVSSLLGYFDRLELEDLLSQSNGVLVKPLYLYDHSGITISTGSFVGRALHAEWDSGQVGYIHMSKDRAIYELLDLSGDKPKLLTDATWKARAEEYCEVELAEYDSYLRGEVYGYQTYLGYDEVDSCWGFNPGDGDIEQLMKEELGGWFGPDMEFEYTSEPDFEILCYLHNQDFPALRDRIEKEVLSCLSAIENGPGPYPFQLSASEIRDEGNGVLKDIVSELYDEHVEPTPERIREALDDHAGISREVKPKLTVADLNPSRDYTIEELIELAKKKATERGTHSAVPKEPKSPDMSR